MPSTGWNVFVASGVALVVYIAIRAEMVLLGLIAGTLTFVVGWLLGYAINKDLLDSMEVSRIVGASSVTVFAIVWTILYSREEIILGLIVVCLAWFAAWFTSSMGPIKGDTGAMATIDEPRPPAGSDPEGPIDLGGPDEPTTDSGGGFLSSLFGFGDDEPREPRGYPADDTVDSHATAGGPETPAASKSTTPTDSRDATDGYEAPSTSASADTTGSAESIFGLGIFYEGDPTEPSAGANGGGSSTATDEPPSPTPEPNRAPSPGSVPSDPAEQGGEPAAADHTRPSATGPGHRDADEEPQNEVGDSASNQSPIDEAALDPPAQRDGAERDSRERSGRQSRTGAADETADTESASETYRTYRGGEADEDDAAGREEEDEDDEPPADHRVDVDDDDGFIFG